MINRALYGREMKNSGKLLLIFAAVLTMYVVIIIELYDPALMHTLDSFVQAMPELMAAMGMEAGTTTLTGFLVSYLYGFILPVFPMIYSILRGNGLVAKYVDRGSMVTLLASPVKRSTIAATQVWVLLSGIFVLVLYTTAVEVVMCQLRFPDAVEPLHLLKLNAGLLCLHLFIGGICFLSSCVFSEVKYSLAFGAGIPAVMFLLQMLANAGEGARVLRYVTFFSLFQPEGIVQGEAYAMAGAGVLFLMSIVLYLGGIGVFCRKDLHI